MVKDTLHTVTHCASGAKTLVYYTPAGAEQHMRRWLGRRYRYLPQAEGDLGTRMAEAFRCAASSGLRELLVVGADCPGLRAAHLDEAFDRLRDHDVVLGPTRDGGYFLIGARRPLPALFRDIAWSTGTVFADTLDIARRLNLRVAVLEELSDVDTVEDLQRYPALHSMA